VTLVERNAVRLIILDAENRLLLFQIREPIHPEQGTCWELPGGGIDDGETYVSAALRELNEETGFRAEPDDVREPLWRRRARSGMPACADCRTKLSWLCG
jgi:8-oxo-dGTP pyrophosphatase MutT (NUDIX family)